MKVFVDTNVLILALANKKPDASVFKKLILKRQLLFSPIVVAEFLTQAKPKDQKLLSELTKCFEVSPVDNTTARITANYRQRFLRKKKKVYLLDCLIAASCRQHNANLLTHNVKDFPMTDIEAYTPQALLKRLH